MSDDDVRQLHTKMDTVLFAIAGNPDMGHKGIAQRLTEVEADVKGIDRKMVKWTGAVVGIGGLATFARDWLRGGS